MKLKNKNSKIKKKLTSCCIHSSYNQSSPTAEKKILHHHSCRLAKYKNKNTQL